MMIRSNLKKATNVIHSITRSIFNYKDPFLLETQLTDDEKSVRYVAYNFSKEYLLPSVVSSFRNEKFDKNIMKEMGSVGLLGPTITYEKNYRNHWVDGIWNIVI